MPYKDARTQPSGLCILPARIFQTVAFITVADPRAHIAWQGTTGLSVINARSFTVMCRQIARILGNNIIRRHAGVLVDESAHRLNVEKCVARGTIKAAETLANSTNLRQQTISLLISWCACGRHFRPGVGISLRSGFVQALRRRRQEIDEKVFQFTSLLGRQLNESIAAPGNHYNRERINRLQLEFLRRGSTSVQQRIFKLASPATPIAANLSRIRLVQRQLAGADQAFVGR